MFQKKSNIVLNGCFQYSLNTDFILLNISGICTSYRTVYVCLLASPGHILTQSASSPSSVGLPPTL